MPDPSKPSSDLAPDTMPPPIPPRARPVLGWIAWGIAIAGPTAGLLIPQLTEGKIATVCTGVLGFLVLAAAGIKGGLAIPWKAPAKPDPEILT